MKGHSRAILGLAIFYAVVVAFLDFFLTKIPVINWLALTFAFIFFAGLILGIVMESRPTKSRPQVTIRESYDDELERLGRTIERALHEHQPESIEILNNRLKSMVLSAYSHHANQSMAQLLQIAQDSPESLGVLMKDEQLSAVFKGNNASVALTSPRDIERLLSRIEDWLN